MTSSSRLRGAAGLVAGVVAAALLGASLVALQVARERRWPEAEAPEQDLLYLSSPAVVTRLALSFDAVAADLYWIRAIQYYGSRRLERRADTTYELLYPLLDLTTSLDPYFTIAYRFGAFFLSERAPGGAGRPDLAIALLEKAMAAQPDRWEYPHDIGFVYYREGAFTRAAEWFLRASERPGAAEWLEPLAAVTLASGGDTRASRAVWSRLLESEDEWMRTAAAQRLRQLDAIDAIAQLEALTAEYARRFGDPPPDWRDMIRAGLLPGIPLDPAGHPYVLNPWWGDVTVSQDSPMWPLPTDRPA